MEGDHPSSDFDRRLAKYVEAGQCGLAIQEITQAIQNADRAKQEEDACYLYSHLAGIYFLQDNITRMRDALDECEARYPTSVLARSLSAEKFLWLARDYQKAIEKANTIIEMVEMQLTLYNRALYLKGLAHMHLGQFQEAVEMLQKTHYYDLALVEKLIAQGIGLATCRDFLIRALKKFHEWKNRESDMQERIAKAQHLLEQANRHPGSHSPA